ncbi:expressed protein [Echinococcus multilocularis]|uniref:Expressed protein n=1 Tax=Echinococcus multilocularis TaxID=6211 RepID=A0A068Y7Y0_ECHMU|nr:expressed protein [Echinococcus multilocularis]
MGVFFVFVIACAREGLYHICVYLPHFPLPSLFHVRACISAIRRTLRVILVYSCYKVPLYHRSVVVVVIPPVVCTSNASRQIKHFISQPGFFLSVVWPSAQKRTG